MTSSSSLSWRPWSSSVSVWQFQICQRNLCVIGSRRRLWEILNFERYFLWTLQRWWYLPQSFLIFCQDTGRINWVMPCQSFIYPLRYWFPLPPRCVAPLFGFAYVFFGFLWNNLLDFFYIFLWISLKYFQDFYKICWGFLKIFFGISLKFLSTHCTIDFRYLPRCAPLLFKDLPLSFFDKLPWWFLWKRSDVEYTFVLTETMILIVWLCILYFAFAQIQNYIYIYI